MGYRCGYVCVPTKHPHYKKHYSKLPHIQVHGGVTYSSRGKTPEGKKVWVFGFDCAHSFDQYDVNLMNEFYKKNFAPLIDKLKLHANKGQVRSLDYCVEQCESLARQLNAGILPPDFFNE